MHMNIEMTLRFSITPVTPIVNSTAESARYHESCGSIMFNLASVVQTACRGRANALLLRLFLLPPPGWIRDRPTDRSATTAGALRQARHERLATAVRHDEQASSRRQ